MLEQVDVPVYYPAMPFFTFGRGEKPPALKIEVRCPVCEQSFEIRKKGSFGYADIPSHKNPKEGGTHDCGGVGTSVKIDAGLEKIVMQWPKSKSRSRQK